MKRTKKVNLDELKDLYEFINMRDGVASTIRIALVNSDGNEELFTHFGRVEDVEMWGNYYLNRRVYKGYHCNTRIVA